MILDCHPQLTDYKDEPWAQEATRPSATGRGSTSPTTYRIPGTTWTRPGTLSNGTWSSATWNGQTPYTEGLAWSSCRFCGEGNGSACLTDGTYVWPGGFAHYLLNHAVRPPQEFVDHVLRTREVANAPD